MCMHKLLMIRSTCSLSTCSHSAHRNNYTGISSTQEAIYLKKRYNSNRLLSVFSWSWLVKSTQMINGNVSPMSPLTVQSANLHAGPSESLTHHSQPGKDEKWITPATATAQGRKAMDRTRFLTLMTSFQQVTFTAWSSSTCLKTACFFSNEG